MDKKLYDICVDFPDYEQWIYNVYLPNPPPLTYMGFTILDIMESELDEPA